MGTGRFVLGYFVSGVVGAFCKTLVPPHSPEPIAGASLAIGGIVHEIHRQGLHGIGGANDGVLLNRQARKATQATGIGGFYGMGAANGALDTGAGNHFGNGSGQCEVCREAAVARGNWHQPARAVNKRGHGGGSDLDCCVRGYH